ncbi:MAG: RES family NAD+ phosphorylase [Actinomycetota bacterium]
MSRPRALSERVEDGHRWLRIADPTWSDPLDPSFAAERGGRWNPPTSFATLYLNEDLVTARMNLRDWAARWPWEPEDLRPDHAPVLVEATLPRDQDVADAHSPEGLHALGLPTTYPMRADGSTVGHGTCQPIGELIRSDGLRGVRARSAQTPRGAGRELAWFPASARSRAHERARHPFADWYWS